MLFGIGIIAVGTPASIAAVADVRHDQAGAASGVVNAGYQVGGALGVAIVGSVFAAVYAAEINEDSSVPAVAGESIEDATDAANRLHGAARADLLNDAVASFDVAARWGLAVCMAVLLLGAASAAVGLSRASPAE